MEGAGERGGRQESRGRPSRNRPSPRIRRAREGRRHEAGPGAVGAAPQGSEGLSLYRQGTAEAGRRGRHRERQGEVRHRHPAGRHALRGRGPSSGPGRQGGQRRRRRSAQGAGRDEGRPDRAEPAARALQSSRRRRGAGAQYLGGDAGAPGVEDHVGRRTECQLRLDGLQGRSRGIRAQARQGRAQRRQFRHGLVRRREAPHGRVLRAAPRARDDGAAGRGCPHHQRQVRGLGMFPVAPGRARSGGQAARHVSRQCHRARHLAGWRLRAQVQAGLRHRGGGAVEGRRRQARQGDVDARRRSAQLLLPHGVGRASRGRRRRAGQAGGVAAPNRGAHDHLDLQRGGEERGAPRARHGRHQRAVRDSQHSHREPGGDRPHADRLVPVGLEHSPCVRGPVVRGRAGRGGGPRSEGFPAGGDRPRPPGQPGDAGRHLEPRRVARAVSGGHRASAARRGDGGP